MPLSGMSTLMSFMKSTHVGMPLEGIAVNCGISHPTAFKRRHRVFGAVVGYQDRIVQRDRV